jgi:tetratricopeptide (TPR) repeat protein
MHLEVVRMAGKSKKENEAAQAGAARPTLKSLAEESQLDFELKFYAAILENYPDYVDVLKLFGNNLTIKGRVREGLEIDRRLVRLRPNDPLAHYNLACSYSLLQRPDPAFKALRRAIELGYRDFKYMKQDRDLDGIRKDPRFRQLLREFEGSTAAE